MSVSLQELNHSSQPRFIEVCGPFFEHSPWIAEQTWAMRPFASREMLHKALCATLQAGADAQKLALIRAHPDLVGRLAKEGRLTRESSTEQAAAGLDQLTADEINLFDRSNHEYRERFEFPFIICARENKKQAILEAFPRRLQNSREREISTALAEIEKIARLRLLDAITEGLA